MADRYLFVTGKLAAPALRETLRRAELPFDYDVAVMKITVAALMTPAWIAKRLEVPSNVTRIMIPGLCEGDPAVLSEQFDVPAETLMPDAAGGDYVLSLTGDNRHVAKQLRATAVLIPDTPDDLDSLDA